MPSGGGHLINAGWLYNQHLQQSAAAVSLGEQNANAGHEELA
jgi:hypothetical protein